MNDVIRGKVLKSSDIKSNNSFEASIHNRFDIEVIDAKTGIVKNKAVGYNTICKNLWSRLASLSGYFSYIFYGTGTGTPSPEDTALFSRLNYKYVSGEGFSFNAATGIFSVKRSIQLSETEHVGSVLTEVGIGYDTGVNALCTHSMLQDMNGNQISIEKTDTDIINIYATIYVHVNPYGFSNSSIFFTSSYYYAPYSWRYSAGLFFFAGLGLGFGDYIGYAGTMNFQSVTAVSRTASFDLDTKTLKLVANRLAAGSGNFANGILAVTTCGINDDKVYQPSMYMVVGGDWYPYSQIEGEAVGTGDGATKDFSLKFPYATDVKIYLDGVETSDYTVDYAVNVTANSVVNYLERIYAHSTPDHLAYVNNTGYTIGQGAVVYFHNPMYEIGLQSITASYTNLVQIWTSNDMQDWVDLGKNASGYTFTIPEQYRHNRFWKLQNTWTSNYNVMESASLTSTFTGKVLHFNNPPAEGEVITADYKSKCIAKSADNVLDLEIEIKASEYIES